MNLNIVFYILCSLHFFSYELFISLAHFYSWSLCFHLKIYGVFVEFNSIKFGTDPVFPFSISVIPGPLTEKPIFSPLMHLPLFSYTKFPHIILSISGFKILFHFRSFLLNFHNISYKYKDCLFLGNIQPSTVKPMSEMQVLYLLCIPMFFPLEFEVVGYYIIYFYFSGL